MIKGTTHTGFDYEITDERANNYELLEVFGELEDKPQLMTKVVNLLLGKEQAAALKDHVRTEDGFVPADKMEEELGDILQANDNLKKS